MKHPIGSRSQRRVLRRPLVLALVALSIVAVGCAGGLGSPDGWAAPVRSGDLIIVQDDSGELTAVRLDGRAATEVWRFPLESDDLDLEGIYATPIIDGDVVYLAAYSGNVFALDIATGRPIPDWGGGVLIEGTIVATPAFDRGNGALFIATQEGDLFIVATENGRVSSPPVDPFGRIWAQPALLAGTLYVADMNNNVRALGVSSNGITGLVWERSLGGAVAGDLLGDGNLLIVGGLDSRLYALDTSAQGNEAWSFKGDGWFWARPLTDGDTIYAPTVKGSVYAINRETGVQKWQFHVDDSEIRMQPVLARGVLVVASRDGFIYGIDPRTGGSAWQTQKIEGKRFLADPLVLESGILLTSTNGELFEVDPLTGSWAALPVNGRD